MWNISGGSWAAPMRGQAARKQPKASHVHHGMQPFSLIYLLSMQDLGPHTSAKTKGVSKPFLKFNQKHTGVPFPLATPCPVSVWRSTEFHLCRTLHKPFVRIADRKKTVWLIWIYQNILLRMCAWAPGRFSCKNPITPSELPYRDTIFHNVPYIFVVLEGQCLFRFFSQAKVTLTLTLLLMYFMLYKMI